MNTLENIVAEEIFNKESSPLTFKKCVWPQIYQK